jgi:hypothetical protein
VSLSPACSWHSIATIQEASKLQGIPRSLIYMFKSVWSEVDAAEIPSNHHENIIHFLPHG